MSFPGFMEAQEFLVSRIVEGASRQHVGLSELERKMLYFSEQYPTLPDMMEVGEKFETEYDDEKYETKIQKARRKAFERDQKESPENVQLWRQAMTVLKKKTYISVMLDVPRSATDLIKLVVAGLVVATMLAMLAAAIAVIRWAGQNSHFRIPDYMSFLAFILVFVLAYYLAYSDKGKNWLIVWAT